MNRYSAFLAGLGLFLVAGAALGGAAKAQSQAETQAPSQDAALSRDANRAFLENNARQPGVNVRPSGLQYRILRSGYGKRPGPRDTVSCYYRGALINGKVFDATEPGFPASFTVNGVIRGWTEALELMRVGDRWQLVIPSGLGYGERGAGANIPPGQTLVFEIELLGVAEATPEKPSEKDQGPGGSGAQD
ncbi:MAG TPA: FKBP-type peptidyl-prolyl cis-trans isomerase [Rhizomicrobium sp.]|nr:FKBP-type peptidyl-prolyl cis-trans isomerase [Rhizomicrobium sp.]